MTLYTIEYIPTGKVNQINDVMIWSSDLAENSIIEAIKEFERIAVNWGSYENMHAIVNIHINEYVNGHKIR